MTSPQLDDIFESLEPIVDVPCSLNAFPATSTAQAAGPITASSAACKFLPDSHQNFIAAATTASPIIVVWNYADVRIQCFNGEFIAWLNRMYPLVVDVAPLIASKNMHDLILPHVGTRDRRALRRSLELLRNNRSSFESVKITLVSDLSSWKLKMLPTGNTLFWVIVEIHHHQQQQQLQLQQQQQKKKQETKVTESAATAIDASVLVPIKGRAKKRREWSKRLRTFTLKPSSSK